MFFARVLVKLSVTLARPSDKKVWVLTPYTTFEGRTAYRKVAAPRHNVAGKRPVRRALAR